MSTSESGGLLLQAYNSCASDESNDYHPHSPKTESIDDGCNEALKRMELTQKFNNGAEYLVLHFSGRQRIPIIQQSDIELYNLNWLTDSSTRSGATMCVYKGKRKSTGQLVALKRFKTYFDSNNNVDGIGFQKYHQAMEDFVFELQILSTSSLRNHRNIVTVLGILFSEEYPPVRVAGFNPSFGYGTGTSPVS